MTTVPATAVPAPRAEGRAVPWLLAGVTLSMLGLLAVSRQPFAALAPIALVVILWLPWKLPLRSSALAFVFLVLAGEQRGDADSRWQSPFAVVGWLLRNNLNLTIPIDALRFTGIDVVLLYLGLIAVWRRSVRSTLDRGVIPPPRPLTRVALVSLGVLLLLSAYGVARGGSAQQVLWQIHQLLLLPLLYLLFSVSLRDREDLLACGKVIVAAALVKAAMAVWIRHSTGLGLEVMLTATSHSDSGLFCAAFTLLVIAVFEKTSRKHVQLCLLLLPPLAWGMIANNRRLAWVEVAMVLILLLVSRRSPAKRLVLRSLVVLTPLALLYVAAGWSSGAAVFAPVGTVRSIVDSKADRSTATRDIENFNLLDTARTNNPLLGTGFGHQYVEAVKMDDISDLFPQYKYIPHNSILGLWAFTGILGFTLLFWPIVAGVYFAVRTYRHSKDWLVRTGAFSSLAIVLVYLVQCYGDMGLVCWVGTFLVALALSLAGKLAVGSGAWLAAGPAGAGGLR